MVIQRERKRKKREDFPGYPGLPSLPGGPNVPEAHSFERKETLRSRVGVTRDKILRYVSSICHSQSP